MDDRIVFLESDPRFHPQPLFRRYWGISFFRDGRISFYFRVNLRFTNDLEAIEKQAKDEIPFVPIQVERHARDWWVSGIVRAMHYADSKEKKKLPEWFWQSFILEWLSMKDYYDVDNSNLL